MGLRKYGRLVYCRRCERWLSPEMTVRNRRGAAVCSIHGIGVRFGSQEKKYINVCEKCGRRGCYGDC